MKRFSRLAGFGLLAACLAVPAFSQDRVAPARGPTIRQAPRTIDWRGSAAAAMTSSNLLAPGSTSAYSGGSEQSFRAI
jgi:hypothetical protein